jgi:hypothetical protein
LQDREEWRAILEGVKVHQGLSCQKEEEEEEEKNKNKKSRVHTFSKTRGNALKFWKSEW